MSNDSQINFAGLHSYISNNNSQKAFKEGYDELIDSSSDSSDETIYNTSTDDGLFTPTRDALQEIFPRASSQQIARYEKIVNQADELDPVLIISPNLNWINQYGEQAYHLVMDGFATEGLQNARRDENSRCVFHFRNGRELVDVRDAIRQRLINAFYIPPSLQATHPHGQTVPVGTAWILTKVGARDSDFWEDDSFFLTL
ncbi:hypothetical protein RhiirA5_412563 [Rhizophagus irregularis]|uniref:Uncharacterized protein n=1 Tax=Rhizophagus irregularis TaxID=588596 RepID=A0A2N0PYD8_9GLOM|nr:hypothetical protein RhiirA5_412563 [Rhizophagus irregularis]